MSVEGPKPVDEIVKENREIFETVADGDDDVAELAQRIIDAAEGRRE